MPLYNMGLNRGPQSADPLWSIRERDRKLESRKLRREVRDGGSAAQGKVRGCMKGEKTGGAFACRMVADMALPRKGAEKPLRIHATSKQTHGTRCKGPPSEDRAEVKWLRAQQE